MNVMKRNNGFVRIELTCAEPAAFLTELNRKQVHLFHVVPDGDLTVHITVRCCQYERIVQSAVKYGVNVKVTGRIGKIWAAYAMLKRPVLLIGILILLAASVFLPTRVLFVEIKGNETVQTGYILEKAGHCGISFGASRRKVRSEKIKNALLSEIPQLQWAGVNTNGCVAVLSVRERTASDEKETPNSVTKIVAAKDGVIESQTIISGTPLCKVGQAVKEGQVLVSGYTDCGIIIQAARAEGEIYANTLYTISAVSPKETLYRMQVLEERSIYRFFVGKKTINLSTDSGISDATCVKMYKVFQCKLPGGFELPVGLIREDVIRYELAQYQLPFDAAQLLLLNCCDAYLQQNMVAGRVLQRSGLFQPEDRRYSWAGSIFCSEMIGRIHSEEIIGSYGKNN